MMVMTVMFFVFSCVLSLSRLTWRRPGAEHLHPLYLANHFDNPVIATVAPLIAMVAISKSFLGHYLGAQEGMNGLMAKSLREKGKNVDVKQLNKVTAVFMILTTWAVATINPEHPRHD